MKYADGIELTKDAWKAIEHDGADLAETVVGRLSRKRCKTKLIKLVKDGAVNLTTPAALYAWTFGAATVQGARPEGVPGKQNPILDLDQKVWDKITPERIAKVVQEYTTESRAANIILALMHGGHVSFSAEDIVYLTNERVAIKGVKAPAQQRKQFDISLLIEGIVVN